MDNDPEERSPKKESTDKCDDVMIQPNPTSGWFSIHLNGMKDCEITLFNAKGEPCLYDTKINSPEYYIDSSHYPSGTYFARICSGDSVNVVKVIFL